MSPSQSPYEHESLLSKIRMSSRRRRREEMEKLDSSCRSSSPHSNVSALSTSAGSSANETVVSTASSESRSSSSAERLGSALGLGVSGGPPHAHSARAERAEARAERAAETVLRWEQKVRFAYPKEVEELIRRGARPYGAEAESYGQTLIFFACQNSRGARAMTQLLVDFCNMDPRQEDSNQQTALFFCAAKGAEVACAEYLVSLGCRPNHRDFCGQTPLYYAAREGQVEMIRALVRLKADVNHVDQLGETPLFWARDQASCEALLQLRADPRVATRRSPRSPETADLLALFPKKNTTRAEFGHLYSAGSLYVVYVGNKSTDLDSLVRLEQEFVDDHVSFLDPARQIERSKWCHHLGVTGDVQHRRDVIKSVLEQVRMKACNVSPECRWTLACVHYPSNEVVGYVHYTLKERERSVRGADGQRAAKVARREEPETPLRYLNIGYLKVDRRHLQRGVASLLLSAVPKHLLKTARRVKKSEHRKFMSLEEFRPFAQRINLSVVSLNKAAQPLYRKFGFQVEEDAPSEVEQGVSVSWCAMTRSREEETLESLDEAWSSLVTDRRPQKKQLLQQQQLQHQLKQQQQPQPLRSFASHGT